MKPEKKPVSGIFFPCTAAQRQKIKNLAAKCGPGQGEYILRRALGYDPPAVSPEVFFDIHDKLCRILDAPQSPEQEKAALRVYDEISARLMECRKQPAAEVIRETTGGDHPWRPSDSGR